MNSIENSVLKNADQQNQVAQAAKPAVQASPAPQEQSETTVQSTPSFNTMDTVPETTEEPTEVNEEQSVNIPEQTFNTTNIEENFESEDDIDAPEDDNHDGLGFDIF